MGKTEQGLTGLLLDDDVSGRRYIQDPWKETRAVNTERFSPGVLLSHTLIEHVAPIAAVTTGRDEAKRVYEEKLQEFADWREGKTDRNGYRLFPGITPLFSDDMKLERPMQTVGRATNAEGLVEFTHYVYDPVADRWRDCGQFGSLNSNKWSEIQINSLMSRLVRELEERLDAYDRDKSFDETLKDLTYVIKASGHPDTDRIREATNPVSLKRLSRTQYPDIMPQ